MKSNSNDELHFFKEDIGGDLIVADQLNWVLTPAQQKSGFLEFVLASKDIFARYRVYYLKSKSLNMLIPDWDHPTSLIELEGIYKLLNIPKQKLETKTNSDAQLKYTEIK